MSYWYPLASATIGNEEIAAATEVLRSGRTTMGDKVEEFEAAFAYYVGADHAVMVNSGSSADLLISVATRGPRGQVLVPAVTWPTQVWSWVFAGFTVKLIDVDGFNTTAEIIEQAITHDTVGVSLVHLMGLPCEMDEIVNVAMDQSHLWITEDCCEALGSRYRHRMVGDFGHAAAWSFFFSHHMTTMEGGMVTTSSRRLAERLRAMRAHGWARQMEHPPVGCDPRYTFVDWGFNFRPTEISAAIGLVQLAKLDQMNKQREANRDLFFSLLDHPEVTMAEHPSWNSPAWFGLPLLTRRRNRLSDYLEAHGVETRPILGGNLARQPAFRDRAIQGSRLPGANIIHEHGLYLGLHADEDQAAVIQLAGLVNAWDPQ